jgi:hypothetical protein
MACAPVRVEMNLIMLFLPTLDSLQSNFLDERYLFMREKPLKQQFKQNIRSNRYWLIN